MHIAILGRQPALSIAELERQFSDVTWFSDEAAVVNRPKTSPLDVTKLGGSQKVGVILKRVSGRDFSKISRQVVDEALREWSNLGGKLTLGISVYGAAVSARDIQKTGLIIKSKLKPKGVSCRLIPNQQSALSSATSHHNKLGLSHNKAEILIVIGNKETIIALSSGAQNITALAARDQGRPKRDAFVGMLPPKLALLMVNLAGPLEADLTNDLPVPRVLDPFCGTGVVLQEAMLRRYGAYGTDLAEKMIRYSRDNLNWLQDHAGITGHWYLHEGDAQTVRWQQPVDAIVTETYLGQPFSAPPSPAKLTEVRSVCNRIATDFIKNAAAQLKPGTPMVVAVPAWKSTDGSFTHLPFIETVESLGVTRLSLKTVRPEQLLYFREDQVVAREILILEVAR